jgi:hypothetical protein
MLIGDLATNDVTRKRCLQDQEGTCLRKIVVVFWCYKGETGSISPHPPGFALKFDLTTIHQ